MPRATTAAALALAVALGGATSARADSTLTSCAPSDFAAAVAARGTLRFAVDCPNLVPTATTVVGAGEVLDIEGDGHVVGLSGAGQRRLFTVTGGRLTVRGVTLRFGAAVGANGAPARTGRPASPALRAAAA